MLPIVVAWEVVVWMAPSTAEVVPSFWKRDENCQCSMSMEIASRPVRCQSGEAFGEKISEVEGYQKSKYDFIWLPYWFLSNLGRWKIKHWHFHISLIPMDSLYTLSGFSLTFFSKTWLVLVDKSGEHRFLKWNPVHLSTIPSDSDGPFLHRIGWSADHPWRLTPRSVVLYLWSGYLVCMRFTS